MKDSFRQARVFPQNFAYALLRLIVNPKPVHGIQNKKLLPFHDSSFF